VFTAPDATGFDLAGQRLATGRLCLALVATVHNRLDDQQQDDLTDGPEWTYWSSTLGITTAEGCSSHDIGRIRTLREAIYRLALAAVTGATGRATDADVVLVNRAAGACPPAPALRVNRAGAGPVSFACDHPALSVPQAMALFARDAIDLLAGPSARLLRQCAAGPCGTLFVDTSRGARRRWCMAATCGNRVRVGAYRDRVARSAND
jgi:predicted RNA-binding Zn ribbon-like protein